MVQASVSIHRNQAHRARLQDTVSDFQRERAAQRTVTTPSSSNIVPGVDGSLPNFTAFSDPSIVYNLPPFNQTIPIGPLKPTPKLASLMSSPNEPSTSQTSGYEIVMIRTSYSTSQLTAGRPVSPQARIRRRSSNYSNDNGRWALSFSWSSRSILTVRS